MHNTDEINSDANHERIQSPPGRRRGPRRFDRIEDLERCDGEAKEDMEGAKE